MKEETETSCTGPPNPTKLIDNQASPELQLLVEAVREHFRNDKNADISTESIRRIINSNPVKWERFKRLVRKHHVGPIVSGSIEKASAEGAVVPKDVIQFVRQIRIETAIKNLEQTQRLSEVVASLESESVGYAVLKGPVIAETGWGGIANRPFKDIDILVDADDLAKAGDILTKQGFTPQERSAPPKHQLYDLQYRHQSGVEIELHWRLDRTPCNWLGPTSNLLKGTQSETVSSQPISTLQPNQHAFYCLLHGASHQWVRLKWLIDPLTYGLESQSNQSRFQQKYGNHQEFQVLDIGLRLGAAVMGTEYRPKIEAPSSLGLGYRWILTVLEDYDHYHVNRRELVTAPMIFRLGQSRFRLLMNTLIPSNRVRSHGKLPTVVGTLRNLWKSAQAIILKKSID